jgi:hypothetical protein
VKYVSDARLKRDIANFSKTKNNILFINDFVIRMPELIKTIKEITPDTHIIVITGKETRNKIMSQLSKMKIPFKGLHFTGEPQNVIKKVIKKRKKAIIIASGHLGTFESGESPSLKTLNYLEQIGIPFETLVVGRAMSDKERELIEKGKAKQYHGSGHLSERMLKLILNIVHKRAMELGNNYRKKLYLNLENPEIKKKVGKEFLEKVKKAMQKWNSNEKISNEEREILKKYVSLFPDSLEKKVILNILSSPEPAKIDVLLTANLNLGMIRKKIKMYPELEKVIGNEESIKKMKEDVADKFLSLVVGYTRESAYDLKNEREVNNILRD